MFAAFISETLCSCNLGCPYEVPDTSTLDLNTTYVLSQFKESK